MSELQSEPNSNGEKLDGRKATQFKPGHVANPSGRPKGSRNKFSENFVSTLCQLFDEGGEEAMRRMMKDEPAKFIQACTQLIPKQVEVGEAGAFSDLAEDKVDEFIAIATRKLLPDRSATIN